MTRSQQQHRALRACGVLMLALIGCREPEVTYGEHAALRPKRPAKNEPVAGASGVAGALVEAGASGAAGRGGGAIEQPPDDVTPDDVPEPITDAGAIDAEIPTAPVDAGALPDEPADAMCGPVPHALLEPTTDGSGKESGCEQLLCLSTTAIDELDLNGLGIAIELHDPSSFQGCTAVIGDLLVHNYAGEDLSALSCLEVISGSLMILGAPALASLDGLEHLQFVTGSVSIGHAASYATDVRALADISALARLRNVLGSVTIDAPMLVSLRGLDGLQAVRGDFVIGDAAALYDLTGLSGLRAVGGDFVVSGATALRGFDGADRLEMIGGSFRFSGARDLRAFDGALASVACVGDRITIEGPNPALEELDLFPALRSVGGDVHVQGNERLHTITMLSHVEDVGGSIAIQGNGALAQVDLGSLEDLGGVMVVVDNPQLEECPLVELAESLDRDTGSRITGNLRIVTDECSALYP